MKKIGVFYNINKEYAVNIAKDICVWLRKIGKEIVEYKDTIVDGEDIDLIISIGGDGTLLRVASLLKDTVIPVLGVNAGNLGFLTSSKADELKQFLLQIFEGNYSIEKRLMLRALVEFGSNNSIIADVLNDIVISREGLTRFVNFTVEVDNSKLMEFGGDGVIISTPTGSSAYSLSAGGPLLYPSLEGILITPICPHSLKTRPVVIGASQSIKIKFNTDNEDDIVRVIFDGQHKQKILSSDKVVVKRSPRMFNIVHCNKRSFYDIVREKL